jgi:hypothetical protein
MPKTKPHALRVGTVTLHISLPTLARRRTTSEFGTIDGLHAVLHMRRSSRAKPAVIELSRLVGEHAWTVDAATFRNGVPHHVNGYGNRAPITHQAPAEISSFLNEHAAAMPEVADAGPQAPLSFN